MTNAQNTLPRGQSQPAQRLAGARGRASGKKQAQASGTWKRSVARAMQNIGLFFLCLGFAFALGCTKVVVLPESGETLTNWTQARDYQAQGRYEMARQHYLLALAASRTPESQQTLQRELNAVDRMIEAMR